MVWTPLTLVFLKENLQTTRNLYVPHFVDNFNKKSLKKIQDATTSGNKSTKQKPAIRNLKMFWTLLTLVNLKANFHTTQNFYIPYFVGNFETKILKKVSGCYHIEKGVNQAKTYDHNCSKSFCKTFMIELRDLFYTRLEIHIPLIFQIILRGKF